MNGVITKLVRSLAAVLAACVAGAAANYYMDLGWFGRYGKLMLSITLILGCILVMFSQALRKR
jgi:hypothetical protein